MRQVKRVISRQKLSQFKGPIQLSRKKGNIELTY